VRNPDDTGTALEYAATEAAAGALGLSLQELLVRREADFPPALEAARTGQAEGLIALHDALMLGNRHRILGFALQQRLPTVFDQRLYVETSGLMSYGPNLEDSWRRAASYVDKILKGANPADLPIEQPTRFDLVVNLKNADLIGLSVPPAVLMQATEVIR
jgi:putative ABC transport system substrate-binding protein